MGNYCVVLKREEQNAQYVTVLFLLLGIISLNAYPYAMEVNEISRKKICKVQLQKKLPLRNDFNMYSALLVTRTCFQGSSYCRRNTSLTGNHLRTNTGSSRRACDNLLMMSKWASSFALVNFPFAGAYFLSLLLCPPLREEVWVALSPSNRFLPKDCTRVKASRFNLPCCVGARGKLAPHTYTKTLVKGHWSREDKHYV